MLSNWMTGHFGQFLPGPQRASLAIRNRMRGAPHSEGRFRFVLCWLEDDPTGANTKSVEEAFIDIEAINLFRSAVVVRASGAADDRRPVLRRRADEILKEWSADLAIFGSVRKSEKSLRLWFMPRWDGGALSRESSQVYAFSDDSYELKNVRLKTGLPEDVGLQIVALATSAAAVAADTAPLSQALTDTLGPVVDKISTLLKRGQIEDTMQRSALHAALGYACFKLGERESGTDRLKRAVAAYRAALEEYTREGSPADWAMTQGNLGSALSSLGGRESGTERLDEAVATYRAALAVFTREGSPADWAMTQNNLGNTLLEMGRRKGGAERFEEAVAAHRAALEERTREGSPADWAVTQNNLGNTLLEMGRRKGDAERLDEAIAAYRAALEERTREGSPADWAMTQNNLGGALLALGERQGDAERLEEAVAAYRAALGEYTREGSPAQWAVTQNNLGNALCSLSKREGGTERLDEAVAVYRAALEERTREGSPADWAGTQNNLGNALHSLGERESGTGAP